jgi:hypothetical protein
MQCNRCGTAVSARYCPRCGSTANRDSGMRVWGALGISFILLSVAIAAGAYWFVEHKRNLRNSSDVMPKTITASTAGGAAAAATTLNLATLSSAELLKLVPVNALSRFKTTGGDHLPDELRVVRDEIDQYLVLTGTEVADSSKQTRNIMVFKFDSGSLADITREAVPADFSRTQLSDEHCQLRFYGRSADLEVSVPVSNRADAIIEECAGCEHAYSSQDLVWCGDRYELVGSPRWRNDAYTAFYLTAQALEKRSIDDDSRAFIDDAVSIAIMNGLPMSQGSPGKRKTSLPAKPKR